MSRASKSVVYIGLLLFCLAFLTQCHDTIDIDPSQKDLTHIAYNPVIYSPAIPAGFPDLEQPADNKMTIDGIMLGRKLFYDPILSVDSTISCSSCHQPAGSFTDQVAVSQGVSGFTTRSSMSLINVGMHHKGLFWDGRAATLEEQALAPVENPIEMGENWDNYNSGGKLSPNRNSLLHPLNLTESQKSDLIAFILTLTDSSTLTNPAFQNPF